MQYRGKGGDCVALSSARSQRAVRPGPAKVKLNCFWLIFTWRSDTFLAAFVVVLEGALLSRIQMQFSHPCRSGFDGPCPASARGLPGSNDSATALNFIQAG